MSIQIIDMSDLGKTLMILGFEAKMMSLEVIQVLEFLDR